MASTKADNNTHGALETGPDFAGQYASEFGDQGQLARMGKRQILKVRSSWWTSIKPPPMDH